MPGCPVCPAARLPGNMPGCPEICPAVRLPGMPGCPVCPAARNYARLSGNMPGCPAARYARLSGMPGCPELCPAVRLSGTMSGCPELCPELCPAARHWHHGYLAWTPNACFQRRRWRPPPTEMSGAVPPRLKIAPSSGAAPAASAAKQCWAAMLMICSKMRF